MEKKKILLIDDDAGFRDELAELLRLSGYEPACACDALEAFSMALGINPDVILLDLKMPGSNGFQLADKFSQNGFLKNIPLIVMTGYFGDSGHNLLMDSCGMKYFLKKPFDSFDLITKIETALADTSKGDIIIRRNTTENKY
ncbi:MAG: response regulator [Candidatus Omnitrophota bacterium]|jgi:CheY-like chemotaxis protein